MKPSNILYCLLAVCLLSGFPARGQTQPIESKYYYSSPQLGTHYETDTATMEEFVYYTVGDLDLTSQPGAPTLPVKYVRFSVPYNAANITVNASRDYTSLSRYGLRVYPVPQPIPTDGSVQGELPMVIDSTIYNTDAYWPASVAELVSDGFYLGDNRVITVAVYPIQYNPMNTFLRFNTEIGLTITYTLGATPGNILVRQNLSLRQDAQDEIKELVENPGQVEAFAMAEQQAQSEGLIESGNGEEPGGDSPHSCTAETRYKNRAQYLIITTDSLAPAFERLAALKRQMGLTVQIKTVSEILADSISQAGDVFLHSWNYHTLQWQRDTIYDAPAKIRKFLRYYYKYENTDFVLLGGLDVPYRTMFMHDSATVEVPTDLYYIDLTTEWINNQANQKKYFNNASPDVFVGRLLCTTQEQVNNYIDKLLRYTLNPGKGNPEYLINALYTEGIEQKDASAGTQNILDSVLTNKTYILESEYNTYPKGSDIIQTLNNQNCGFISINNHGAPNNITAYGQKDHQAYDGVLYFVWALDYEPFGRDNHTVNIPGSGLNNLNNKYSPAIMYSISCKVAPYGQMESPYNEHCSLSFAQSFTLGKDYGGPAFIGNTNDGHKTTSKKIQKEFANQITHLNPLIGRAEAFARTTANPDFFCDVAHRYAASVVNLIGDPNINMWTVQPTFYSNIEVQRTDSTLSISGLSNDDSSSYSVMIQ